MKVSRTYRLDSELVKQIQELAREQSRSEANMVEHLLKQLIDKREQ